MNLGWRRGKVGRRGQRRGATKSPQDDFRERGKENPSRVTKSVAGKIGGYMMEKQTTIEEFLSKREHVHMPVYSEGGFLVCRRCGLLLGRVYRSYTLREAPGDEPEDPSVHDGIMFLEDVLPEREHRARRG